MGKAVYWLDNPQRTVAYFDAIEVMAWLKVNGLVDVEIKEKKDETQNT